MRRYVDPMRWIYIDDDGDVHFDGPAIAKEMDLPLEEVMHFVEALCAKAGIETQRLYTPQKAPRPMTPIPIPKRGSNN